MDKPEFSIERYNSMQNNRQKANYLRSIADKLVAYDEWLIEKEAKENETMQKHVHNWLFDKREPSLAELRKKYLGEQTDTTVGKDKNGKTIIIENGIITGSQG